LENDLMLVNLKVAIIDQSIDTIVTSSSPLAVSKTISAS
jgi:hypothetical protein